MYERVKDIAKELEINIAKVAVTIKNQHGRDW